MTGYKWNQDTTFKKGRLKPKIRFQTTSLNHNKTHTMKKLTFIALLIPLLASCGSVSPSQSDSDYTRTHPAPKAFDPNRTQYTCATWTPPPNTDVEAEQWYRAATLLHAKSWRRTVQELQDMVILYEAAASRGHYRAINNLYLLYTGTQGAMGDLFDQRPDRARKWLHYGLEKDWAMAYYWLFDALYEGHAGYSYNPKLGLAYLQKAVELGVPLAQYELARIYEKNLDNSKTAQLLFECSAKQGFSAAMDELSTFKWIDGKLNESLLLMHNAVRYGGEKGGESALLLTDVYSESKGILQAFSATPADPIREAAYHELYVALKGTDTTSGNIFYTFPRLDEVLPLPPAKTHWKGIYSAMSKEDAAFYQNPPNTAALAADILKRGIVKKEEIYWPPRKE